MNLAPASKAVSACSTERTVPAPTRRPGRAERRARIEAAAAWVLTEVLIGVAAHTVLTAVRREATVAAIAAIPGMNS